MLSIDEAIAHEIEVAAIQRNNDKLNKTLGVISPYYKTDCTKCAEEHEQLADWLEELKKRRSEDYGYMADIHQSIGYRQAIDDFMETLVSAFDETNIKEYGFYPENLVRQVAKQLKAGVKNETN